MCNAKIGLCVLLAGLALAGCAAARGGNAPTPDTGQGARSAGDGPPQGSPVASQPEGEPEVAEPGSPAGPSGEVAIYTAVIRQLYTVDHTFGTSPPNWPHLYILGTTDDTISGSGEEPDESRTLSAEARQGIETGLGDLPGEIRWLSAWEDAPVDPQDGSVEGGEGVIITLGNIHEQADGSVHVPAGLYCGGLCATGMTYVLEVSGGGWQVTGTTGPAWIS